jgi:hypothetical protein
MASARQEKKAARASAGCAHGKHFGVRLARTLVPTFTDDLTLPHQHATHPWIGLGRIKTARRKPQRARHPRVINA